MAAYSALISLGKTLKDFIESNPHQIFQCRNGRHLFESLQRNVISLQELFDKYPREVGKWEEKIHDFCNEAESIIEDYIARAFRRKQEVLREWLYCVCECKKQSSLHSQIFRIGAEIDKIVNEMKSEMVLGASEEEANNGDDSYLRNFSHLDQMPKKERLFGFEGHLKAIKNCLIYGNSNELQVVPIVGMGGIGKTSLARALFDDGSVAIHFDVRRWVMVSRSYDVKAILLAILGVENPSYQTNVEIRDIGEGIHKMLFGKRYLIVLDDIWDTDAWDVVRVHLNDGNTKSRVLLTTRREDVARYAKPLKSVCDLELLNKETSWSMLKYKVFGEKDCPLELEEIGQKIAEGCYGLPLAIVVIAGILINVDPNRDSWDRIANDVKVVERGGEKFSEVLALSYHHLPHYLRPYFLFMATCSKGESLQVGYLLNSLISERFFKPNKRYEYDVKEMVMECLKELLDRNLITVTKRKYNGKVMSFGIHDLMRDLSIKVSKEEKFFHRDHFVGAAEVIRTTRRAHFDERPLLNSVNLPHLRTVICDSKDTLAMLERCQHLRILITGVIVPLKMLSERLELSHLRHLHLTISGKELLGVSSAISKLVNLEYLAIVCDGGGYNPGITIDIWKLPKLRYFHVIPAVILPHPIVKTSSPFLNLLFLWGIGNFRFTKDSVKQIPNVRGMSVHYSVSSCAGSWSNYCFENLCDLTHLEKLKLCIYGGDYDMEWCNQDPLMNYITFPSSLRVLLLFGNATHVFSWEDITTKVGLLPNLEKFRLRGSVVCGDEWEVNKGYFPNLRVLEVTQSCLKCWRTDGSGDVFPKLERLILIGCLHLTNLPDDIGDISTLGLILVDDRQEDIVNWAEEIKQYLSENGNELFRVIVLTIDAELKKCEKKENKEDEISEEKESKEDEMFDHPVREDLSDWWVKFEQDQPDKGNKLFRVLLAKIAAELMKYQQFELAESNQSKIEFFWVIACRIIAELNKYEKEENERKVFYHRKALEFFRHVVHRIAAVLQNYEEEQSKEQKMHYYQEAYTLFQSIVQTIFKEKVKCDEEEDMYLKMHTYLRHSYFVEGDQGLYKHAIRSIACSHPHLAKRLSYGGCPLYKNAIPAAGKQKWLTLKISPIRR